MSGLLLQAFDRLAQAPGGVARLRELILSLAVRGKLLPQDPADEPAESLLARSIDARRALAQSGRIGREKPAVAVDDQEADFKLPTGWVWCRLSELAWPQAGFAFKSTQFNETGVGLPLIRIRDVGSDGEPSTFYSGEYRPEFIVEPGEWLVSMDGEFRVRRWHGTTALLNQRVTRLVFFSDGASAEFVVAALQQRLHALQGVKAYTTVDHLSGKQISDTVIALPPTAEQARIVARVDELMRLCDELEAKGRLEAEQHTRLLDTLLGTLTDSTTPEELAANWQRVAEHFDLLLDRPGAVDALEQTILQLAVRGLLVSQDTTECTPPADSNVLRRSGSDPIDEAELPYDVPSNWQWVRLGSVADLINGDRGTNYPNKSEYVATGLPFINTGHIEPDGTLSHESMHYLTRKKFESLRGGKTLPGDLVYCLRGATLGKTAIVEYPEGAIASSLVIIRLDQAIDRKYMYYYLTGPMGKSLVRRFDNGSAQPNLAANSVKRYVVPLPPAAEQRRIVARVEEFRRLCADLRQRLAASQATQSRLAEALVDQVA